MAFIGLETGRSEKQKARKAGREIRRAKNSTKYGSEVDTDEKRDPSLSLQARFSGLESLASRLTAAKEGEDSQEDQVSLSLGF